MFCLLTWLALAPLVRSENPARSQRGRPPGGEQRERRCTPRRRFGGGTRRGCGRACRRLIWSTWRRWGRARAAGGVAAVLHYSGGEGGGRIPAPAQPRRPPWARHRGQEPTQPLPRAFLCRMHASPLRPAGPRSSWRAGSCSPTAPSTGVGEDAPWRNP